MKLGWSALRRHLTTFEWYGLAFYLAHLRVRFGQVYKMDLAPLRIAFSIPSFGVAFWLWESDVAYTLPGFKYIASIMHENVLGMIFFLHGFGLVWRVFATSRHMLWSILFGFIGMLLYWGYPYFVWLDIGHKSGQGIAMAGWGVVALWAVSRLGSGEDRSGP